MMASVIDIDDKGTSVRPGVHCRQRRGASHRCSRNEPVAGAWPRAERAHAQAGRKRGHDRRLHRRRGTDRTGRGTGAPDGITIIPHQRSRGGAPARVSGSGRTIPARHLLAHLPGALPLRTGM